MKTCLSKIVSIALCAVVAGMLAGGTAVGQETSSAKVARLLNESKLAFTKQSETVWTVPFEGKNLKDITVVMSTGGDLLVVFAMIAQKKDVNVTPELMQRLLRSNEDFDRVKIGIDKEGDVFARVDISIRVLDSVELKANVEQTSAAADEVFGYLKSSLIKKK